MEMDRKSDADQWIDDHMRIVGAACVAGLAVFVYAYRSTVGPALTHPVDTLHRHWAKIALGLVFIALWCLWSRWRGHKE